MFTNDYNIILQYNIDYYQLFEGLQQIFEQMGNKPQQSKQLQQIKKTYFNMKKYHPFLRQTISKAILPLENIYPLSCIGLIICSNRRQQSKGIGFIIDQHYLLTSASNCYSHQTKSYLNKIRFYKQDKNKSMKQYQISKIFIRQKYINLIQKQRKPYNYALLEINTFTNFKEQFGICSLNFDINNSKRGIFFYQNYRENNFNIQKLNKIQLTSQQLSNIDQNKYISLGGTPIFKKNGFNLKVVGICGKSQSNKPQTIRFTNDMYEQLKLWIGKGYNQLHLDKSMLKNEQIKYIKTQDNSKIEQIHINNNISQIELKLQILTIINLNNLRLLNLSSNYIGDSGCNLLKQAKFKLCQSLNLSRNEITSEGCIYLSSWTIPNLKVLNLSHNHIHSQGCKQISQASWPKLQQIDLNFCFIRNGCHHLNKSNWKYLRQILLINNEISYEDILQLSNVQWPNLNKIILGSNNITHLGCQVFKPKKWKNLTVLAIQNNKIGNKGCKLIKRSSIILSNLFLCYNMITPIGIKWISKLDTKYLTALSLNGNNIDYEGSLYLSKTNLISIQYLSLQQCCMNANTLKILFKNNLQTLQELSLVISMINSNIIVQQQKNN